MTPETAVPTVTAPSNDAGREAFQWLRVLFTGAPILVGLMKFTDLVDWTVYLWSGVTDLLPVSGQQIMLAVGVVEIIAGLLVAVRPRIGAYVVAGWLGTVIVNLLLVGGFYDVVVRDVGLLVAALVLGRLAGTYGARPSVVRAGR